MAQSENENLKHQWKQWIDVTTRGFKDKLKEEGKNCVAEGKVKLTKIRLISLVA